MYLYWLSVIDIFALLDVSGGEDISIEFSSCLKNKSKTIPIENDMNDLNKRHIVPIIC